jgi:predicted RNA-binding protein YlqC (UPF0109 family)
MTKEKIADYLISIVLPIAPAASCTVQQDDLGTLLKLSIPEENKGRVLGKGGETIKAIRHIVGLVGYANGIRTSIKVI